MADQKLSQLTASGALTGAELAYVVQGGNSRRTTLAAIVALAAGTDLSYNTATRILASSTGSDVTLPLFTSSLAGLVGASGGGTTNFLRADGTWAAPPTSAGTDLSYDQATRLLSSSTGADVTLPLATDALDGLMSAAHRALIAALIVAGVSVTGSTVAIPHIHGDLAGSLYIHVKNTSGAQLTKGTPVRVTGAVGDTTTLEVAAADAASAGTMPAIGILSDTLAVNGTGHAVVGGELTGLATDAYSVGQALYVAAGGGLTGTKPTSGTVQQVAIVGRVHASTGSVTVTIGALLSPNWDTAYSERLRWDGGATGLDAATGRTSLGLGTAAPLDVAATGDASASQVVKGSDSRLSDARTPTAHTQTASTISDSTPAGRALLTAADAAAQLSTLGAAASGAIGSSGLTMATARLLGRSTASTGAPEEITVGSGLTLSAGTLSATTTGSGTKTLARFTARDNQPPASNFATLDTRNGISVLEFDAATEETAAFISVVPEGAALASGLLVRIWWMGDTATSGNVRWAASFERSGTDLDADSFDTATEVTSAANGTSGIETVAEITCTAIDSLAAGERFRLRIARKATDAVNDTMTGDAQLVAVEVRGVA